ncbi:MAG: hypothetical protein ACXV6L_07260 [Halobacteriota archaeon]
MDLEDALRKLHIPSALGVNNAMKNLVDNGGIARGVSHITNSCVDEAKELPDIGEDLRYYDRYGGCISVRWIRSFVFTPFITPNEYRLMNQL